MFKKAGKKTSKVLAYLLALMVMVGYVPTELLVTAMAADGDEVPYTIIVKCGDTPLEDVLVTASEDPLYETEVTGTTDANGEVTLTLKEGESYVINAELEGYELNGIPSITVGAVNSEPKEVLMSQLATITGIVKYDGNAYKGATVTLSGYTVGSTTTDENGEFELTGHLGEEYTVTITPKAEDEKIYSVAERTFTPDVVNYALAPIDFSIATYKVSAAEGITHGTVKFYSDVEAQTPINDLEHVPYDTNVTVKVEADEDYRIKNGSFSVTGDGIANAELDNDNKFTFKVKSDVAVSVEFEQYLFAVTDTSTESGRIAFTSGVTDGKAEKGSNITYTITPPTNYCIDTLTIVNGDETATIDKAANEEVSYNGTLEDVAGDIEFNATFKAITYTVTLNITGNGTINYNSNPVAGGSIGNINKGTNLSFDVIADSANGYHIQKIESSDYNVNENEMSVSGDGTIGENDCINKTVTIPTISKAGTVTIEFAINTYTVTGVINNTDVTSNADGSISVENGDTFNYGDDVTIKFKPTNNNKSQKRVSALTINKFAEDGSVISSRVLSTSVSDNDINYNAEEKLCVLKDVNCDIKVSVLFDNIEQLVGDWEDHVSITPEYVYSTTDDDNKIKTYIYSGEITITPKDAETYNKGVDFLVDENKEFEGMQLSRKITESTTISLLQVQRKKENEKSINLEGYKLVLLIDETQPTVNVDHSELITNKQSVTISGTATDVNVDSNAVLGLDRVVYTTGTKPADETAVKALTTEATLTDGKFEINVDGTTELNTTYYIYAIDVAGNVSEPEEVKVVIDKTAPTITNIEYEKTKTDITYKNDGIYCFDTIKLNVSVNDDNAVNSTVVSGINQVKLYLGENGHYKIGTLNNGVATFELTENDFKSGAEVKLKVSDIAGNEITKKPSEFSNDDKIYSDYIIVSSAVSIDIGVTSKLTANNDTNQTYSNEQNIWYKNSENIEVAITAKDELIGLKNIKVLVNGVDITDVNSENKDTDLCGLNEQLSTGETKTTQISPVFVLPSELLNENEENTISVVITNNANGVTPEKEYKFFIDTTAPKTDKDSFKFSINNKANTPFEDVLNILSFGTFFNEEIIVTVETIDDENDSNSGLKSITLYKTVAIDEKTETSEIGKIEVENFVDGKAEFILPADVTKELKQFDAIISAKATDNVGNTTEEAVIPTTQNSNIESEKLMIETVKPEISTPVITASDSKVTLKSYTADNKTWYNTDVDFAFSITDANSGIRSVVVKINKKEIIKEDYYKFDVKTTNLDFKVSTSQATANEDGSYTLTVDVIDNAGNVAETKTVTVYKDITVPEIDGFKFEGVNEKQPCVETAEYGFYFKQDTKVTISATDVEPTSGIKEITYYTVDVDSGKTDEVAEEVNENGEIEIEIKANFKGQIYAKVNDNVLNTSKFVSPDKTVVESEDKHKEETHIAFKTEVEPTGKTSAEKDNDLYATDVPVTITVIDTYSGIESIEWSVVAPYDTDNNQEGSVTVKNDGTLTDDSWDKTQEENSNLITNMFKTITVNNNSNDIVVKVTMTDRAGNTTTDDISFSIDKTAPVIEVAYDNNTPDAEYDSFYKANRTATITITERNFNPDDVKIVIENTDNVIPKLSNWTKTAVEDGIHPDGTVYTAKIDYVADGDYTFDIDYSDRATNAAEYVVGVGSDGGNVTNDDFVKHEFTIDKTNPVVKVTYDNNKALNKNYYDAERTATITVTEHNFDASRIVVTGEATDNGKKIKFPAITGWSSKGDVHTTTINYKADAEYTFDIKVTDKADNVDDSYKVETFFVDKTAPEVEITGVANNSANNGKVAPVVNYTDTNFTEEGVTVSLTGINRGRVDYSRGVANVANGQTMSYENFRNVKEVDDIYTLTAKVVDKAGNETTKSITFSVNRFGSTYNLEAVKSYNNKYIQSMGDLVFTEVNVNSLDLGNIRVKLTKNGTPSDLVLNKDFTVDVAGGGGRWYTYTYTIKSALFQDDAKYSLSFYSVDASGNVNENIDETKEAVVSFAVDKTKPVIIPIDLAEGERYKETVKNVTIEVKDNLLLEDVKIYLNDSEVEYTVEGESYTIQVPESTERQTIKIVAVDAAGNEYETVVKDFLVSTNAFVQFVNNTPVFIGSIVALVVVIGAVIAFIILGKKKRRK